jgi:hypothetical protein
MARATENLHHKIRLLDFSKTTSSYTTAVRLGQQVFVKDDAMRVSRI